MRKGSYDKAVRILEALEDESDVSDSEGIGSEAVNILSEPQAPVRLLVTGTPVPVALEITNSFEPDDTLSVKKDEWDEMKATIAELKSQSRAALVQKVVAEINPEKPEALPVTCETEMRALEATLANRDDFAYHVSFLHSRAVSLDIKPFLWRVMSNIFDSKFARVVNMNGSYHARVAEGRGKLALKKDFPKILNLIEVTVRLKFKSSELKFIHTTVGQWLQDSISRAGGRRQRSLESELRKRLGEQQNQPATE
ncbi:hypothetical protein B566_EDAN004166 [Ephemera danica]|nr:hypothetical protein B566_EDAN004166 [Ephemera danica]